MGRLLIFNAQMPIRDGYSTTHEIRTQFKDTPEVRNVPIIAMTASAIQGDREKCEQAGMDVSGPPLLPGDLLMFEGLFGEAGELV